jgi:hypothetical protein
MGFSGHSTEIKQQIHFSTNFRQQLYLITATSQFFLTPWFNRRACVGGTAAKQLWQRYQSRTF